jgi:hypothetical protein
MSTVLRLSIDSVGVKDGVAAVPKFAAVGCQAAQVESLSIVQQLPFSFAHPLVGNIAYSCAK